MNVMNIGHLYEEQVANMTTLRYLSIITFLLAPSALSVAELSGENLCHKRETYTVTIRVLVKEPVQVKSYTWCLKVPPRCTKYKVEMRDKYKTQTEVREQVVDVCCAGYAPDLNETYCLPICSRCVHGVCASPDTCMCEAGYIGQHCDTECSKGLWGAECKKECSCRNGAVCHHINGDCKCSDGWRGIMCDAPCPKGTYGHACLKGCNCGDDGKNSTCHHITGECLSPEATADAANQHNSEIYPAEISTAATRTLVINNEKITTLPTETRIVSTLPSIEKHVLYTTVASDTISSLKTTPVTTVITREEKETTLQHDVSNNSITKPTVDDKVNVDSDSDENDKLNSLDNTDITETEKSGKEKEASTEPQNFQIPPREIIVVSDGLISDRMDEEERINESKDSRNGIWDLVSSVSVAGGVALVLIVMAAVTLLISHHRNKEKISISGNKLNSADQQQSPAPGPQMYNYAEDVITSPLRNLFPDATYQATTSEELQLRFGDVASSTSSIQQPYSNVRAYLELQYDIPPSSISSKTSSFQPGLEPEHLYDEIPCWRSNTTTTTNTDTDTSCC